MNIKVTMTVDNSFAIYTGTQTAATTYVATDTVWESVATHTFNLPANNYIYIVTRADSSAAQGFLGQFENLDTGYKFYSQDPQWQVMATGLGDASAPYVGNAANLALLSNEIIDANNGGNGRPASTGWVNTVAGPLNGSAPWGSFWTSTIDPAAAWVWHMSDGGDTAETPGDPTTPAYDHGEWLVFRIQVGATPVPIIAVSGNSVTIADGDGSPTQEDDTDFLTVAECGDGSVTHVYTIHNSGNADLNLTGSPAVTLTDSSTGSNSTEFTVTQQPGLTTIPPGGTTTFSVTFSPTSASWSMATVSIPNDDSAANPYDFEIQGTGIAPEIDVTGSGNGIIDGSMVPSASNGTYFGMTSVGGAPLVQTYTITNSPSANSPLELSGVSLTGANPGDFDVSGFSPVVTSLLPGESVTFTVTFSPLGSGVSNATITIYTNDCDEGAYDFAIQGQASCEPVCDDEPEIDVSGVGQDIIDGSSECISFGKVLAGYGPAITHTFTITNNGATTLAVNDIQLFPVGAFTIVSPQVPLPYAAAIAPGGGSMTFQVSFNPTTVAQHTATITILNNDSDENPFLFTLCGSGVKPERKPEIDVRGLGVSIADGDMAPDTIDDTNFGTLSQSHIHEFEIHNTNPSSVLTISPIAALPTNSNFTVITQPASTVVGGNHTTFKVQFNPPYSGARSAIIKIINNDSNEALYDFKITAVGRKRIRDGHPIEVIGNARPILAGDSTPTTLDHTTIGNISIGQKRVRTFTIHNIGEMTLTLDKVSAMGIKSMPSEFTIRKQPARTLAPGEKTTFKVQCSPAEVGPRFANIKISYMDESSDEEPKMTQFKFKVKGTGKKE